MSGCCAGVAYCLHDDHWFVQASIESFRRAGQTIAFVSRRGWNGTDGCFERCAEEARSAGAEVIIGDWPDESLHRSTALEAMRERGFKYVLIPDGDEIVEPALLHKLLTMAETEMAGAVRVSMQTYWKSPDLAIRPPELLRPLLLLDARIAQHQKIREYDAGPLIVLGPDHGVLHHLSYCGPDERIQRKLAAWGHRNEVASDWYRRVWLGWDRDPLIRNLHPTHPQCYAMVERIETPEILRLVQDDRPRPLDPDVPINWPSLSVVVPLYGGEDDIRRCLQSLEASRDLLSEVIVVDDASPDQADDVVKTLDTQLNLKLIHNDVNRGFAASCNVGFEASAGQVVLFLNSDTQVPRAGLIRLVEALVESGTVGAVGPFTNNAGFGQAIVPTYTDTKNLDLFARGFAYRKVDDLDVSMLVGFCLAVRRSVLEEQKGPPFDEAFARGLWEDNDLCYRILRAGYKLRLATRAYVHHEGSKSLGRMDEDPRMLLEKNRRIFEAKWRQDLESGFASHLSGLAPGLIQFRPELSPERKRKRIRELAELAHISLCMIVKNEERVLGDCLASAKDAFSQVIVVDTGSSDRTREIARAHEAELYDFPWTESFSEARNESLKHAKGRWIFWLDADDTMPMASLESILRAALDTPADITGFVVPVQFVDGGLTGGTRVDHVKLFRNLPGVRFEGRIHEQVLGSLRAAGGQIARLDAVVLHSGYDTSPEGQARKRARDDKLLRLDLEERPDHPFALFNMGMTRHYQGEHAEAVGWLRKSIKHATPSESHIRKAYALMGVSIREQGDLEGAVSAYTEGLSEVGSDPELLFQRALVLTNLGRLVEAKRDYLDMPLDVDGWFTSIDRGILGYKRFHNLGSVCRALGDYEETKHWLKRAIAEAPEFTPSSLELFEAAMVARDYQTARDACDHLRLVVGDVIEWVEVRERLEEAANGARAADNFLRELCATNLRATAPAMCLARRLCRSDRESEAIEILIGLQQAGFAEAAFYLGIAAIRRGAYGDALSWMRRTKQLDPSNLNAQEQIGKLEATLCPEPIPLQAEKRGLLLGPHVEKLGQHSKRFSVVIVTYNSEKTLETCLNSVLPTLGPEDELIVLDNASVDGTLELASKLLEGHEQVVLLKQPTNIGYSPGANFGMLASRGQYLVLLNPDTEVPQGWLETLQSYLKAGYAAVGPVSDMVAGDQFVAHWLPKGTQLSGSEVSEHMRKSQAGRHLETKLLVGFCLMISREVLNSTGLLFEETDFRADDLEFSWRLRMLGYRLAIVPEVFVRHDCYVSFASLPKKEQTERIESCDTALIRKLVAYYGRDHVPSSTTLFGCDILDPALAKAGIG